MKQSGAIPIKVSAGRFSFNLSTAVAFVIGVIIGLAACLAILAGSFYKP